MVAKRGARCLRAGYAVQGSPRRLNHSMSSAFDINFYQFLLIFHHFSSFLLKSSLNSHENSEFMFCSNAFRAFQELSESGFPLEELRDGGFEAKELYEELQVSAKALLAAGYDHEALVMYLSCLDDDIGLPYTYTHICTYVCMYAI